MSAGFAVAEESLADLGHRLRTPLTHIIGYSALLLEDENVDADTIAGLRKINHEAEVILACTEHWLAPASEGSAQNKIAGLKAQIAAPLEVIIRAGAGLSGRLEGPILLDVLRINRACTDLLAFVQAHGSPPRVSPALQRPSLSALTQPALSAPSARILVVDDNPGNRDMLDRQLALHGHRALSVENGAEALTALETGRFDVVLLDVIMPGMSGLDVLERIKAMPALANVPVIMISALDEVERAARCIDLGAEDYLVKPCDPVLLRARLHSALERKRLHAEQLERTRQLEAATHELERANEDLQSFATVASHDLQEPLRTITTMLELFCQQSGDALPEEQRELSRMAVDGAARMRRLISALLSYSMAGRPDEKLQAAAADSALLEALRNLREAIRESGASISHEELPLLLADRERLVQLFQNLIGNSIKYKSAARPQIRIRAHREGEEWTISVQDNGIGIDEKYRRKIFQPFGRLHGRELAGTGLGLAICERIVRRWGGRIWVESAPDAGSIFYFTARTAASPDGTDL